MLKKYFRREAEEAQTGESEAISMSCISVIESEEEEGQIDADYTHFLNQHSVSLRFPTVESKENIQDINVNRDLNESQTTEVRAVLGSFTEFFTDIPGTTDIVEHEIVLTSLHPVRSRPYPVPYALRNDIKSEIETMLRLDIIEPCTSSNASHVVIVKKPDGTNRFCCDFRKLNQITVFDAEPVGNPDELFSRLSKSKYLLRSTSQIKVKESSRHLTAFITSEGLYSFKKMPFELVNAGASFCRMMRCLLRGLDETDNFVDDILVHTETWSDHLKVLCQLLERLKNAKLTARPTKCVI